MTIQQLIELAYADNGSGSGVHVAIVDRHTASLILDGKKLVETRFSLTRQPPYGKVRSGDVIFIKVSGGAIVGHGVAERVRFFANLNGSEVQKLRERYDDLIQAKDSFWATKHNSRYATFVYLTQVKRTHPMHIDKRDRRGWVVVKTNDIPLAREDTTQ